eukprot:2992654-Pleurochrysis_carterae.AAC.2
MAGAMTTLASGREPAWLCRCGPECWALSTTVAAELAMSGAERERAEWLPVAWAEETAPARRLRRSE